MAHAPPSRLPDPQEKIAVNKEVVAAVSNFALISADGKSGMLKMWIDGLRRAKVTNFMVICIDDQVAETMKKMGVPYWRKDPVRTADKANSNHGISALKFQLVKVRSSQRLEPAWPPARRWALAGTAAGRALYQAQPAEAACQPSTACRTASLQPARPPHTPGNHRSLIAPTHTTPPPNNHPKTHTSQ